jgi:hypothetical protein
LQAVFDYGTHEFVAQLTQDRPVSRGDRRSQSLRFAKRSWDARAGLLERCNAGRNDVAES